MTMKSHLSLFLSALLLVPYSNDCFVKTDQIHPNSQLNSDVPYKHLHLNLTLDVEKRNDGNSRYKSTGCSLPITKTAMGNEDLNMTTIKIGFFTPYNQNQLSLGAVRLAVEMINNDSKLLPGRRLEFIAADIGADIASYIDSSDKLNPRPIRIMTEMRDSGAVAFIGGPEDTCVSEALVAAAWRLPMISFKCSDYQVSEKSTYHTFARTLPPSSKVIKSVVALLKAFNWDQVVLVTCLRTRDRWYQIYEAFKYLSEQHKINVTGRYNLLDYVPTHFSKVEEIVKLSYETTRVYVFIGEHVGLLDLVKALENRKLLDSGDYIIISADDRIWKAEDRNNFFEIPWLDPTKINSSGNAFKSVLKLTRSHPLKSNYPEIIKKFANYSAQEPFNVPYHSKIFVDKSADFPIEGAYLYDAVMIYAQALTELLKEKDGDPRDGSAIFQKIINRSYHSVQGFDVFIDENGDAEGNYTVIAYLDDENGTSRMSMQPVGFFEIRQKTGNESSGKADDIPTFRYFDVTKPIQWVGGKPPKSEPHCGFRGENCVYEPDWKSVTALLIFTSATVVAIVLAARHYLYEQKLACLLWKIDMREVVMIPMGPPEPMNGTKSTVALCRQLLGTAVDTDAPLELACKKAYTRIGFYKGMVVAIKPIYKRNIDLTRKIRKELFFLIREFRHENIIPFIGASVEHGNICVLTAYSARGSLEDVLQNEDLHLDNMFLASLVADLIKGMIYLHDSEIISHGNLKSSNCLVDSRWVLQIADFGLHEFKAGQEIRTDVEREHRSLLWRAPELLRLGSNAPARGSQKGDVYSFGIILYEMIGRHGPWGKTQLSVTEIIERVAHPELIGGECIRPATLHLDCGETILKCLDTCWEEDPELRPDFRFIRVRLKEMQAGLKPNIFDNMLSIMEKYACNLEDLVQERTNQLMEEKKKTDALLHSMLPKSVAESLKRGEPVEAESFDSVTIYFSDIVGFTALSAVSTPMQVVELLNDLYTCFDSIISNYDVYKVETIGDAYMVVSGLPLRNGDQHAGEVASMALHLLDRIQNFEIRHRPNERLNLRIGIHSGPVVAGVVGLKMPRYCLFGDTVNTASRMESSGEALQIHISDVTKELLDILGGYQFAERGIIPIKGKGEMRTYWLTGDEKSTSRHLKLPPAPPSLNQTTSSTHNNYQHITDLGNSVTNNNYNGICNLASTDKGGNMSLSPNKSPNLGCCQNQNLESKENHINVLENVSAHVHAYKPTTWLLADCNNQSKLAQTSKTGRYVSCSNILQECKASIIKELKRNGSTCATTVCNSTTNRFRSAPIITFIESAGTGNPTSSPHFHLEEPRFV